MSYTLQGSNFTRTFTAAELDTLGLKLIGSQQSYFKTDGIVVILLSELEYLLLMQVDGAGSAPGRIGGLRKEVKRMNVNVWFAPNKAFHGRGHFGPSRRSHRFSWKPLREHTSSPQRGSREREPRLAVCPGSMSGGVQFVGQPSCHYHNHT